MQKQGLALFDFDGTITKGDSFKSFIRYMAGRNRMYVGFIRLLPWIAGYKTGWIPNDRAKEKVLIHFFSGMQAMNFTEKSQMFAKEKLPDIIRKKALEKIKWHKSNGDRVVVVSASIENYLKPWCESHGVECIGTRLETVNEKITGKIEGQNCHGPEKVLRIGALLEPTDYAPIYAYGDTAGDYPMMALADNAYFKPFR